MVVKVNEKKFYLQDTRSTVGSNVMWWGKNGGGYVTNIEDAHIYNYEDAKSQNDSRATDLPWLKSYVDSKTKLTVDCQHLKTEEVNWNKVSLDSNSISLLITIPRKWDGNDVYWKTLNKDTTLVSRSTPFTLAAALRTISEDGGVIWPLQYIFSKAVKRVSLNKLKLSASNKLAETSFKKKRKYHETYHCTCGKFVSVAEYYGGCIDGDCQH